MKDKLKGYLGLAVSIAKGNLADLISRLAETEETERE